MKTSEIVSRINAEMGVKRKGEWPVSEILIYINKAIKEMWTAAIRWNSSIVVTEESHAVLTGASTFDLTYNVIALRSILHKNASEAERTQVEVVRIDLLPVSLANGVPLYASLSGMKTINISPSCETDRTFTVNYVKEAPVMLYNESLSDDTDFPFPDDFNDLVVSYVLMRAFNRIGGKVDNEVGMMSSLMSEFVEMLEHREGILLECIGPWTM